MESVRFSLNGIDIKKVLVHVLVYAIGYGAIAGLQEISKVDLGSYTALVGLGTGALIDLIRKFLQGK